MNDKPTMTINETAPWTRKFWGYRFEATRQGYDSESAFQYAHGKVAEEMAFLPLQQKYEILRAIELSE